MCGTAVAPADATPLPVATAAAAAGGAAAAGAARGVLAEDAAQHSLWRRQLGDAGELRAGASSLRQCRRRAHSRTPPAPPALQVEGAALEGGRTASVWDTFANQGGKIMDGSKPTRATDFYNKYKEDIALMKSLGVKNFRCGGGNSCR